MGINLLAHQQINNKNPLINKRTLKILNQNMEADQETINIQRMENLEMYQKRKQGAKPGAQVVVRKIRT